tara:strand:- start:5626 stop:6486 length:861 start_codon:yes stop_codon:yes gene_type:complete
MKFKNYYYLDNTIEHFGDIIKGDTGEKGYKGFDGDAGSTGLKGLTGAIGPDGLRGARGIQGKRGNKGDLGDQGDSGKPGLQGIKGNKGTRGPNGEKGPVGPRGPRGYIGPRGDKGEEGRQGLQGPKGESGKSFSSNAIDTNPSCTNWISIPKISINGGTEPKLCPGNDALVGIKTRSWKTKVEQQVEECYCKRKVGRCWWSCCKRCKWVVNHDLTRWQYNKVYEICCAPMPFKGNGQLNKSESNNELIDPYFANAGSEDPSSPLYGLTPNQLKEKSLPNYPFHLPV